VSHSNWVFPVLVSVRFDLSLNLPPLLKPPCLPVHPVRRWKCLDPGVEYSPPHEEHVVKILELSLSDLELALRLSSQLRLLEDSNLPLEIPESLQHLNPLDWHLVEELRSRLMFERRLHLLQ
jgi:hypothetical protein